MNAYSIKDNVAGTFGNITLAETDGIMIRDVKVAINSNTMTNRTTMLALRPEDFALYRVGTYDLKTGVFVSEVDFVVNCSDLKVDVENGKV